MGHLRVEAVFLILSRPAFGRAAAAVARTVTPCGPAGWEGSSCLVPGGRASSGASIAVIPMLAAGFW